MPTISNTIPNAVPVKASVVLDALGDDLGAWLMPISTSTPHTYKSGQNCCPDTKFPPLHHNSNVAVLLIFFGAVLRFTMQQQSELPSAHAQTAEAAPFSCNVCQRSYTRIDHLARHYRSRK